MPRLLTSVIIAAEVGSRLVGWEIVHFQHKIMLYEGQGLGWRFSSARLIMMANDTCSNLIPDVVAFLFSDDPKWERIGEAHLSYYASDYN